MNASEFQWYYILGPGHIVIPATLEEWGRMYREDNRRVGWTELSPDVFVSTVFLGLDHNFSRKGPPILFETMVHCVGLWLG